MRDAGSAMSRIFGGIKGALGNLQHTAYIGPKALNGGELIIAAGAYELTVPQIRTNSYRDGTCEYMHRMQNTVDHTNVAELIDLIGVSPETNA